MKKCAHFHRFRFAKVWSGVAVLVPALGGQVTLMQACPRTWVQARINADGLN